MSKSKKKKKKHLRQLNNSVKNGQLLEAAVPKESSQVVSRSVIFQGPLPPPGILGAYENAIPGSANRILEMAEKEQGHRHTMESKIVCGNNRREATGQWLAFVLYLLLIVTGGWLINQGKDILGVSAIAIPLLAHIGSIYYKHSNTSKSDTSKKKRK